MIEGQPSSDSVTIRHENAKIFNVYCMADGLDKRNDGPAEEVGDRTFNVGTGKHNHVLRVES